MHRWTCLVLLVAITGFTAAAEPAKGIAVKIGKLTATAPAEWKKEKPANLLRSYQFKLPGAEDFPAPELAIYPESNPSLQKNFPKWKAQFVPPEGKTIDDIAKTGQWDVPGATVNYLDITGTWKFRERPNDPKSKEMLLNDYRVVWVIVAEKDEATHIRLSGPVPSVAKSYKQFEAFVKGMK
jgi:hypothetical protein